MNSYSEFQPILVEGIYDRRFRARREMRKGVFEDIKVNYNGANLPGNNALISPDAFKTKEVAKECIQCWRA